MEERFGVVPSHPRWTAIHSSKYCSSRNSGDKSLFSSLKLYIISNFPTTISLSITIKSHILSSVPAHYLYYFFVFHTHFSPIFYIDKFNHTLFHNLHIHSHYLANMKFQSSIVLAILAISTNASPMPAEVKAGTTAATGINVQAFTDTKGGAAPPVIQSTGDRPFSVNGDTFVNSGVALQRSCDVQNNACATEINSGKETGAVSDCNAQQQECTALVKTTAASITAQKVNGAASTGSEVSKGNATSNAQPAKANENANTSNSCGAVAVEAAKKGANNATANTGAAKTGATNGTPTGGAVLPDGRVAQNAVATDFNVLASKFKSTVVKGDCKFYVLQQSHSNYTD